MPMIQPLAELGRRIMICGPSNAGKSTLAAGIGCKLGIPAVHLDVLRHLPGTDWVRRPDADFAQLHDEAVIGAEWVMDGNYSDLFPQRMSRATGIILINHHRVPTFVRYIRRTLFQKDRIGGLDGNRDSIKWDMVHWVLVGSPRQLRAYNRDLPRTGLPFAEARGMRGLNRLYAAWGLPR
jgi:adenylate kinase family enzyme